MFVYTEPCAANAKSCEPTTVEFPVENDLKAHKLTVSVVMGKARKASLATGGSAKGDSGTTTTTTAPTTTTTAAGSTTTTTGKGDTGATTTTTTAKATTGTTKGASAGAGDDGVVTDALYRPGTSVTTEAGSVFAYQANGGGAFGLTTSASGSAGNWSATPVSRSSTWNVGLGTGAFTWSYPIPVAPSLAGPKPSLALSYNSQLLDGMTGETNNQGSWVGAGWNLDLGFIERKYKTCADDGPPTANDKDLCYFGTVDGYTISLNGQSDELLPVQGSTPYEEWRLKSDPGWRVRHFYKASLSGTTATRDNDGEYWVVTTPDGTRYYFGGDPTRNSVWPVPVKGNDSGEPCFPNFCDNQAWRWNLDRVIDVHGNAMVMTYDAEGNRCARGGNPADSVDYIRGGSISRIDYGLTGDTSSATDPIVQLSVPTNLPHIEFSSAIRCKENPNTGALDNSCNSLVSPWGYWDMPSDLVCLGGDQCTTVAQRSPSFFTHKRLTEIRTYSAGRSTPVDTFKLVQEYPNGTDISPKLYLRKILRVSGALTVPEVRFDSVVGGPLANRVQPTAGEPTMTMWRVDQVTLETGGRIRVTYGQPSGCNAAVLGGGTHWDDYLNPAYQRDCYPAIYAPPGGAAKWAIFNKYVVTQVREMDRAANPDGTPEVVTNYNYLEAPGWRFERDLLRSDAVKSWAEWRGYGLVAVSTGSGSSFTQTTTRLYRGLQGDRCVNTTAQGCAPGGPSSPGRNVLIPAGFGVSWWDEEQRAGNTFETLTIDNVGNPVARSWFDYWDPTITAYYGDRQARMVRQSLVRSQRNELGTWLETRTDTGFDSFGYPSTVLEDADGNLATTGDQRCSLTSYARELVKGIADRAAKVESYSGSCGSTLIGKTETFYDRLNTSGAISVGDPTAIKSWSSGSEATAVYTRFDPLGRVLQQTPSLAAPANPASDTRLTPISLSAAGVPYVQNGYIDGLANPGATDCMWSNTYADGKTYTVSTSFDTRWGVVTSSTDANNNVTTAGYDDLGRRSWVKYPTEQAAGSPESVKYAYQIDNGAPSGIRTDTLQSTTGPLYLQSWVYLDAFGRERETSTFGTGPTGSIRSAKWYDDSGRVAKTASAFSSSTPADGGAATNYLTTPPTDNRTSYDALGRPLSESTYISNALYSTTTHGRGGGWDTVTPPVGAVTQTHTDGWGRQDLTREWQTPNDAGDTATVVKNDGAILQFFTAVDGSVQYRYSGCGACNSWSDTGAIPSAGAANARFQRVSVTKATDGHLVVAASDSSNAVYVAEETSPGGAWGAWNYVGCCVIDLTVVWVPSGPWVFGIGLDNRVYDIARVNGVWQTGWGLRAGSGANTASLSAVTMPNGTVAVAISTNDNFGVWVARQPATGGQATAFGAFTYVDCCVQDLSLSVTSLGTLYLAGLVSANGLWHKWEAAPNVWTSWVSLGSTGQRSVGASRFADGRLIMIATDASGRSTVVMHAAVNGAFTAPTVVTSYRDTSYVYDKLNRLTQVTGPDGAVTQYSYDWLGRRLTSNDPDAGAWQYRYDARGNVVLQQETRSPGTNVVVKNTYDGLGRLRLKQQVGSFATNATVVAALGEWQYDAANQKGLLDKVCTLTCANAGSFVTDYGNYDARNRLLSKTYVVANSGDYAGVNGSYTFGYSYDLANHVTATTFPSVNGTAETVTTTFNNVGRAARLVGSSVYVDATWWSDLGQVAGRNVGDATPANPWVRVYNYDQVGRVSQIGSVRTGLAWEQNDLITYDPAGNVTRVHRGTSSAPDSGTSECFFYDQRNRLSRAATTSDYSCGSINGGSGPNPYDDAWVYSGGGNITHHGRSGADDEYTYGTQVIGGSTYRASVHGVSSMVGSQAQTFGYNQSGQLVKRFQGGAWLNFTWDALGRLAWAGPGAAGNSDSVPVVTSATPAVAPAGSSKFSYDVDSTRRLRVDPSGARTLYLDGFEVAKPAVGASMVSKYYAIDGESVALRRQQLAGAAVPVVIEAESASQVVSDNTNLLDPIGGASGGSARVYSGGWSNFIRFSLGATVAGTYSVKLRYSTAANTALTRRVLANGAQVSNSQSLPATGWAWGETTFNVTMTANAAGTLQFTTDPGNGSSGEVYFDKVEVTAPAGSGNGAGTVTYLFANYQGSIAMAADHTAAGVTPTIVRNRYSPFGENRASDAISQTQHGWIGQTEDPTGLAYLNARYYDPKTGRFLTVDPITDPFQPQTLNGYTYAFNSPGSSSDPTGLSPDYRCDSKCLSGTSVTDSSGVREQLSGEEAAAYDQSIMERRAKCFAGEPYSCGDSRNGLVISGPKGNNPLVTTMLRVGVAVGQLSSLADGADCGGGSKASCAMAALPFLKLRKLAKLLGRADDANDVRKAAKAVDLADEATALPRLSLSRSQIEAKFKHAADFGVTESRGSAGFDAFGKAVDSFVEDANTVRVAGTYRGDPAILNYSSTTAQVVVQAPDGAFISGWKMSAEQLNNVILNRSLGGG